ncbi:MAG: hypothetical protein K6G58_07175 [Lachnospiraceae bacterium]|nr:hypothetical protein [Lachnospiraceae bacterium]
MAIIPINDIPRNRTDTPTQRDLIRFDIADAIKRGVSKFEFDGDGYKYSTLARNASQTFKMLFVRSIYEPAVSKAKKHLEKEFPGEEFELPGPDEYIGKAAVFSTRKMDDRQHVFCSLNIPLLTSLESYIYIDVLKTIYRKNQKPKQ